jgi:hypothetical protein
MLGGHHAFVGFVARHFADQVEAMHIHFPRAD